jgi:hypothetical protein
MTYTLILVRFHLHISVLVLFIVSQHWRIICTFILKYDNKYTYNETPRSVRILVSSTFLGLSWGLISCYHTSFVHSLLDVLLIVTLITKASYCIPLNNPLFIWGTRWRSGWGTTLQTGRSRDQFPMVLEFLIDIILPAALWSWGRISF